MVLVGRCTVGRRTFSLHCEDKDVRLVEQHHIHNLFSFWWVFLKKGGLFFFEKTPHVHAHRKDLIKEAVRLGKYNGSQSTSTLRLLLSRPFHDVFYLGKLLIVFQAFWIRQRAACLDCLARHNLLDGQFNLFQVDRSLFRQSVPEIKEAIPAHLH